MRRRFTCDAWSRFLIAVPVAANEINETQPQALSADLLARHLGVQHSTFDYQVKAGEAHVFSLEAYVDGKRTWDRELVKSHSRADGKSRFGIVFSQAQDPKMLRIDWNQDGFSHGDSVPYPFGEIRLGSLNSKRSGTDEQGRKILAARFDQPRDTILDTAAMTVANSKQALVLRITVQSTK